MKEINKKYNILQEKEAPDVFLAVLVNVLIHYPATQHRIGSRLGRKELQERSKKHSEYGYHFNLIKKTSFNAYFRCLGKKKLDF